jgi:omega-amidase
MPISQGHSHETVSGRSDERMPGGPLNTLTVGMCQIRQGYDFRQNLDKSLAMIDEACSKGAQVVVLTEMFFTPYEPPAMARSAALAQEALEKIRESASKNNVMVVAGSMPWDTGTGKLFNRAFVVDGSGQVIHHHDKIHLFDCTPPGGPAVKESDSIVPGDFLGTFETPWGKAAVVVCYDIRFSPLTQLLADQGVTLLFIPAAFSLATGTAHWEMLVKIRAVELQGFVVGVQPARNPDLRYVPYGHSLIASPWGEIILDAGEDEGVAVATMDLGQVQAIRDRFPLITHRRLDLYRTDWRAGS